ncbi:hypothetical protein MKW98_031026 [Papaver atlanticum]|uniref:Uncharacterized protein n=1 Tax=Papaver atlanticum TaxID=357466 RepID=A0AAD4X8U0_9MAGN|nr:hypothetical protein MKW98_031026 [Papaver atlanticum]
MAEDNDDLDELLDSALDDFHNLNLTSSLRSENIGEKSEDKSFPSSSSSGAVQGLLGGLPDLKSKKKGKQSPKKKEDHVTEAFEKLREQTREAVRGLESTTAAASKFPNLGVDGLGKEDGMMDDWVKQFEEMAGSQDMESIVETMMQQLLSKEILHEPMKEIGTRYPKWLEEHKSSLSKEDYDRYSHQYELIKELNQVYDRDPGNFTKIVELMQKMQECGQPPSDIVQELAPDLDFSNLGQLSPEMLDPQQGFAELLAGTISLLCKIRVHNLNTSNYKGV